MTRTLYKRKGVVSETSHKAWRQLMLSDIDNLKYPTNTQHIPKQCLIDFFFNNYYYFFINQKRYYFKTNSVTQGPKGH